MFLSAVPASLRLTALLMSSSIVELKADAECVRPKKYSSFGGRQTWKSHTHRRAGSKDGTAFA
jgi:hypothetical protein